MVTPISFFFSGTAAILKARPPLLVSSAEEAVKSGLTALVPNCLCRRITRGRCRAEVSTLRQLHHTQPHSPLYFLFFCIPDAHQDLVPPCSKSNGSTVPSFLTTCPPKDACKQNQSKNINRGKRKKTKNPILHFQENRVKKRAGTMSKKKKKKFKRNTKTWRQGANLHKIEHWLKGPKSDVNPMWLDGWMPRSPGTP